MNDTLLAVAERSGLIEQYFHGAVAVAGSSGETLASFGDVERSFFMRSAAKPFQAHVALSVGLEIPSTHVAVATSSHSGDPVHVAIIRDILARHDLSESALRCPPARPFPASDRRLAAAGDVDPSPTYHNCSAKHAVFLAACRVAGWDIDSYQDPAHPLQRAIEELMSEVTGDGIGPPGVDGCGAPVWRVTVQGLARAYRRLGAEERFRRVRTAMTRYPMLVSGEGRGDGSIARWTGGPTKGGAAGCMGAATAGRGIGAKAWGGSGQVAAIGVTLALDWMGVMTRAQADGLANVFRPPVMGGGHEVGRIRPVALLESM